MKTYFTRFALATTCIVSLAAPAWAHAHLQASTPSAGSRLQISPAEISMDFTEGLELAFSGVTVTDPKGAPVSLADPVLDGPDAKQLSANFTSPLLPGPYHVAWHALSKDGHKTEGSFEFAVGP
jgi:copper resistance protein C